MPDPTSPPSVLVVAHSPTVRGRLAEALRARGVSPVEAVNFLDAVRTMAPGLPDRIVVASRLGSDRGLLIARALGKIPKTAAIPVVLVVGDEDGIRELKGTRLRPAVVSVLATETIEPLVDAIMHPEVPPQEVPSAAAGGTVAPGRVATLDAAFAHFDQVLQLIADGQLPGPVVPDLLMRVRSLFDEADLDSRKLVAFVGQHQALAVRLLHMANSAYYGATSRVVTIDEAVTRLGNEQVQNVLQAVAALEYLERASGGLKTAIANALGRGYLVAMASQSLAEHANSARTAATFTVGLFHNIGISFLLYAAALLQEKLGHERIPLRALVTMAHHQSLEANRIIRRAMHLPVEIEALYGVPAPSEAADAPRPDADLITFVQQAMWAADRVHPAGTLPLALDGDAQLTGIDTETVAHLNRVVPNLLPLLGAYRA
jgi:CheY-like chemotaxis protein